MKNIIEKVWRLPSPEKRRNIIIPLSWFNNCFNLKKDSEYLCYLLVKTIILVGMGLLIILFLDVISKTAFFIDPQQFNDNKLVFPIVFSQLTSGPVFLLSLLFYLRIRLTTDIQQEKVPILMNRALLVGYTKRRWILRSLFIISVCIACTFLSHGVIIRFVNHFNQQDNFIFIFLSQLAVVIAFGIFSVGMVSYALVLEKAARFFSAFELDLLAMNPLPRHY